VPEAPALLRKPNIRGGDYTAIDTGDGWYLLRGVPLVGMVPKEARNLSKDFGLSEMRAAVAFALSEYERGAFVIPLHKGHKPVFATDDPEFLGFALPRSVEEMQFKGEREPFVFGDLKIPKTTFDRMQAGLLPYISAEINRETFAITSVAALDSVPPHFHVPLMTIGKVDYDPAATFAVKLDPTQAARFQSEETADTTDESDNKAGDHTDAATETATNEDGAGIGGRLDKIEQFMAGLAKHCNYSEESSNEDPDADATPEDAGAVEMPPADGDTDGEPDKEAKMSEGIVKSLTAQIEALKAQAAKSAARTAALEDKTAKAEAEHAATARFKEAVEGLAEYEVGDKALAILKDAAAAGDKAVAKAVEGIKEIARKKQDGSFAAFEESLGSTAAMAGANDAVAKFEQKHGPAGGEAARKALVEWHANKKTAGRSFTVPQEFYIESRGAEILAEQSK